MCGDLATHSGLTLRSLLQKPSKLSEVAPEARPATAMVLLCLMMFEFEAEERKHATGHPLEFSPHIPHTQNAQLGTSNISDSRGAIQSTSFGRRSHHDAPTASWVVVSRNVGYRDLLFFSF